MMPKIFDVCIRGDGVVGRTLALLLARERLRVALVSQPPDIPDAPNTPDAPDSPLVADVRAYALNSASRKLLESLRVWPDASFATPVTRMEVRGDDGGHINFTADSIAQEALAWIVDVPALEQQLAHAVRYQPQIELMTEPAKALLTIVCEGKHSSSRDEFGVQWTVKTYPQKAIAARLDAGLPHQGVARQWFVGGDVVALLPLGGSDGSSVALVWSASLVQAAALKTMPADQFCAALQAICGQETGSLQLTSERATWPLALSNADRWVGAGWALAGDAAHTVHPLSGQGLNLGLADVTCLAGVLAQREYWRALGDERLLRRYERARKADVAALGAVTDGLHGLFAQADDRLQMLRNWGMNNFSRSSLLKRWITRQAAGL